MAEKIYRYFAEGECEEKLLNALKMRPSLIQPGGTGTNAPTLTRRRLRSKKALP